MVLTLSLLGMSLIFVGIYLIIKKEKNSIICILIAAFFLFLALISISSLVGEPKNTTYQLNEKGEIVLF